MHMGLIKYQKYLLQLKEVFLEENQENTKMLDVYFKFIDGKDEQEIAVTAERRKKQGVASDNLVTTRLERAILAVDNIKDRNKIAGFIRNMPARDSLAMRRFLDKNEPGIDMKSWMTCPHCDEQSEVRLPMGATFFWPDAEG